MVLSIQKLGRYLDFPSMAEVDRCLKSDQQSSSLCSFRSKISEFVAGMSELASLTGFSKCFELIHASNRALADMAIEIELPMSQWGSSLTSEYLCCTSDLLGLLNAVTSSVNHLTHAKMCLLHALTASPPRRLNEISASAAAAPKLKFERPIGLGECQKLRSRKEHVLLHALILCKRIGSLALGFVVSGLCGDAEPYMETRRNCGVIDGDSLLKDVDSMFYRQLMRSEGVRVRVMVMDEVREVNMAIARFSAVGRDEVKRRLKVVENSLMVIEKQSDNLFSQILSARSKLLATISFPK